MRREAVVHRPPVARRDIGRIDVLRFNSIDGAQQRLHIATPLGVRQKERARHNPGYPLHGLIARTGLQHGQFPACRPKLIGLPQDAAEKGTGFECRDPPARIHNVYAHRPTEAQIGVDPLCHEDKGHVRRVQSACAYRGG